MYPPSPYQPGYPPVAPARKGLTGGRIADIVATVVLTALLLVVGLAGALWTAFGVMATDPCSSGPDNRCNWDQIDWAYRIGWGGLALSGILALIGILVAALIRKPMFIWPTAGLIVAIAALGGWAWLLSDAVGM